MNNRIYFGNTIVILFSLLFFGQALPVLADSIIQIGSNPGGRIGDFVSRKQRYEQQGALVSFSGSCDSACTLLLALPHKNTCITPDAVFRFHAPKAASARTSRAALNYMMAQYPGWVRNWLSGHNGLTTRLVSMDYRYASKFMQQCNAIAAR